MENRFCRYELRTTDVDAARAFYADLLGEPFWGEGIDVVPLPAQAAARGAPPHWLGHIGVDDVEEMSGRFVASGAERLGPVAHLAGGGSRAILRDPFGAILAVSSVKTAPRAERVVWHVLHVQDEAPAFALYASLFGWTPLEALDLGRERGRHLTFTWDDSGRAVGSAANTASRREVHPQWLFFFGTDDLERSLAIVRARGGLTLATMHTSSGDLVAACDDPEGAAFALYQRTVNSGW
jgi:predicted enzyme related to lactoylglutathione lyase